MGSGHKWGTFGIFKHPLDTWHTYFLPNVLVRPGVKGVLSSRNLVR
jgi:hypothetical protein